MGSEDQEGEIQEVWDRILINWSTNSYGASQCETILYDWRTILLKRAEDAAKDKLSMAQVAYAFEHECTDASTVLFNIQNALLWNVSDEWKEDKSGTLWWIQSHHHVYTQPDEWTYFSPINEKFLNQATAGYLEKPWLQHNFIDWSIINASIFNQMVELSNGLKSGQLLGKTNWAYIFSENKLEKQVLWGAGLALLGFLFRWIIPPASAIALMGLNYETAAQILTGLWAVYVFLRIVGLITGWGKRKAQRTEAEKHTETMDALMAVWLFTNSNVINPTRLREHLEETDKRGVGFSVPAVVYSLVDRAIERDAAVFTHFFE